MVQQRLLEMIWQGAVQPARGADDGRLARMIRALIPVQSVLLSARRGVDRIAVMLDEVELMPLLPLGDVLAEELSVDVPYGALVILREAPAQGLGAGDGELSHDLGLIVGEAMLAVLRSGVFSMECETRALYAMACSFDRLIEASGFRHLGIQPDRFRSGLAGVLGAYWSGVRDSRAEASGLFDRTDFLRRPELLRYLEQLDASFRSRLPATAPAGLMHFPGGVRSFPEWLAEVEVAVGAVLAGPQPAPAGGARTALRGASNSSD